MGAWNNGIFDNDDAMDWLMEFQEGRSVKKIKSTLRKASKDHEEYFGRGLAAAETVAIMRGHPCDSAPKELIDWLLNRRKKHEGLELNELAITVAQDIVKDKDIHSLWEDAESRSEWIRIVKDLIKRLKKAPIELQCEIRVKEIPEPLRDTEKLAEDILSKDIPRINIRLNSYDYEPQHLDKYIEVLDEISNLRVYIERYSRCPFIKDKDIVNFIQRLAGKPHGLSLFLNNFDYSKALAKAGGLTDFAVQYANKEPKHSLEYIEHMPELINLCVLGLTDSSLMPRLDEMRNLKYLDQFYNIKKNHVLNKLPESLEDLHVSMSPADYTVDFKGTIDLSSIYDLPNLKFLHLYLPVMPELDVSRMPLLERLDMPILPDLPDGMSFLRNPDQLKSFSFQVDKDDDISFLKSMKNLEVLNIEQPATSQIVSILEHLPNLKRLNIDRSKKYETDSPVLDEVTYLPENLEYLSLSRISPDNSSILATVTKLKGLDVVFAGRRVTDQDLDVIRGMKHLEYLAVCDSSVRGLENSAPVVALMTELGMEQKHSHLWTYPTERTAMMRLPYYDCNGELVGL